MSICASCPRAIMESKHEDGKLIGVSNLSGANQSPLSGLYFIDSSNPGFRHSGRDKRVQNASPPGYLHGVPAARH